MAGSPISLTQNSAPHHSAPLTRRRDPLSRQPKKGPLRLSQDSRVSSSRPTGSLKDDKRPVACSRTAAPAYLELRLRGSLFPGPRTGHRAFGRNGVSAGRLRPMLEPQLWGTQERNSAPCAQQAAGRGRQVGGARPSPSARGLRQSEWPLLPAIVLGDGASCAALSLRRARVLGGRLSARCQPARHSCGFLPPPHPTPSSHLHSHPQKNNKEYKILE